MPRIAVACGATLTRLRVQRALIDPNKVYFHLLWQGAGIDTALIDFFWPAPANRQIEDQMERLIKWRILTVVVPMFALLCLAKPAGRGLAGIVKIVHILANFPLLPFYCVGMKCLAGALSIGQGEATTRIGVVRPVATVMQGAVHPGFPLAGTGISGIT